MPNKLIAMLIVRRLIMFLLRGLPIRSIASELSIGARTVVTYRKRIQQSNKTYEDLLVLDDIALAEIMKPAAGKPKADRRTADFLNHLDYYLSELARRRASRVILFEEYSKLYPDGYKYAKFCELLRDAQSIKNATLHNEYAPGDKLMFDFAGKKMHYVDKQTGEIIEVPVFVAVCPYSSFAYVEALQDATLPQVIKALNNCLQYLGGAPASAKTDNMKQVVVKPNRYEPTFTELIEQWSLHNGIALFAARVRKPKDKGPAEVQVRITYDQIYARMRDDVFYSLRELNDAIRLHLEAFNHKLMQRQKYSRYQRFLDIEKPALKPLPDDPYVIKHRSKRKISFNYHFKLHEDGHQYSVPAKYIDKQLTAVYDTDTVEIYDGLERILVYPRVHGKGYTTLPEHMPSTHKAYHEQKGMDSEYFLRAAEKVGPSTRQYMDGILKSRPYQEQAYEACRGILRFAQKVSIGPERLELACQRGLRGENFSYRTIDNILQNNQDKLELKDHSTQTELFPIIHENLRGPESYK
jgi:transposase